MWMKVGERGSQVVNFVSFCSGKALLIVLACQLGLAATSLFALVGVTVLRTAL